MAETYFWDRLAEAVDEVNDSIIEDVAAGSGIGCFVLAVLVLGGQAFSLPVGIAVVATGALIGPSIHLGHAFLSQDQQNSISDLESGIEDSPQKMIEAKENPSVSSHLQIQNILSSVSTIVEEEKKPELQTPQENARAPSIRSNRSSFKSESSDDFVSIDSTDDVDEEWNLLPEHVTAVPSASKMNEKALRLRRR